MSATITNLHHERYLALASISGLRRAYAEAKATAERSLDMDDGVVAGRAFARLCGALEAAGRPVTDRDALEPLSVSAGDLVEEEVARLRVAKWGRGA